MVYGDTNSTLAGALAAAKLHIPVAHVEAGLRSFNKKMPEEINRILTDHASDILFTPTLTAIQNLEKEGIEKSKIVQVGDVMLDATNYYTKKAETESTILSHLNLSTKEFVLVTIHRAENTDNGARLKGIFDGFQKLAENNKLVLPLHPRTRNALLKIGFTIADSNICFTDPVGYLDMLMLEKHSNMIITDSGGVQKEAYFQKVPCITLRNETEWTELVDIGCNFLSNPDNLLSVFKEVQNMSSFPEKKLYGNGGCSFKNRREVFSISISPDFHYLKMGAFFFKLAQ